MTVALVTGAGGAIGRAIALRLAEAGYDLALVDLDETAGADTARLVEAAGRSALFIRADVTVANQVEHFVAEAETRLGPIAAFANNAGIEGTIAPIHLFPDEIFDRVQSVNVRGVFLGLKHVLARMIPRGAGAVVNTGSTSSIRGRAGLAAYVASKHAVLGLTRVAALEAEGTKVRVNAVLPGPIESRMIRSLDEIARSRGSQVQRAGSARYGRPEDVAVAVAFLLSDSAVHINGAALTVDAASTVP
ncbi:SDR family NAD(P)-dependent oxidoreductase [Enterovirga aerilata]|uniref:SDR family oxidoreductase n=1 Tax=Enterovirga aerilata TaxID=2730920 RepID=A0A849IBP8_9HYPH|nr:SDR family NAD(P)-dependent oxidoreductase [Enterovirga sp. DB1703]NNM73470.1 SDR family oxidoreductase [Enterovirga sp. DB1703]